MKLSACLIVRNEKDHIRDVLSSLTGVDEIVVVDTGSIDNTVDLAREFTDKIFTDYQWNDDFAEARNHARMKCEGDWILSIDGDEVLEKGGAEKIRALVENARADQWHFSVLMTAKGTGATHNLPRIFRNDGSVIWVGAAHETLSPVQANRSDVVITYGSSTAHALDPDRMLRILAKVVNSPEATPRDLYYYAREFWYRRDYVNAVRLFEEYVSVATWPPEKADALLYIARGYFILQQGDKAREACLEVIGLNPDFKEALLFMAELHFEPWKHKWERLAEVATNEDVIFKRV
jgi:glycosyltransferase involved in cell wall biosynthesis